MAHRLTNEELDEQFELFLNEPVSDDSVDLGGSLKQSAKGSQKSVQKPTVPWWQDDEHSGGGKGPAETKSRFVKANKSQPEKEVVNLESSYKPVPKPRSKAVDKSDQLANTQRDTVLEASQSVKKARTQSKDSSSDSTSTHENFQCASGESSLYETHPSDCDSPLIGDCEDGLQQSGKGFVKSLKKSEPVEEEEEDSQNKYFRKEELNAVVYNRHVTKADDPVMVPGMNMTMGLDTLEEEEEKARFFAQLEAGTSSAIDYSKLNKELDSTTSTLATNFRKGEKSVEQSDDDQRKIRDTEATIFPGSPHYSEDFEDEENKKEQQEERSKLSPILAKVSLYDSLDDYEKKNTSLDRVLSNMPSVDTDMEALREAYRQIHVVENMDDHTDSHYRPISPSSSPHQTRQSLQRTSTNESELPTAEELMKPIRPEEDHIRGFTLQPVSDVDLKSSSQDASHTESQPMQPGRVVTEIKGNKGSTTHQPSCPETVKPDLTWSVREEVKKLMQDHQSCTSHISCDDGRAKKHTAFRSSSIAHPSTSSVRKSTVAPVRGRKALGTTAVTPRSMGITRAAAPAKIQNSSVSHSPRHPPKASCTKSNETNHDTADPGLKVSNELVASVQSLVTVLQQQIHTSRLQGPVDTQNADATQTEMTHQLQKSDRDKDSSVVEELTVQLAVKERQLQMMKEEADELQSLRQQNFLLQSKLRSAEEQSQKGRWADAADPATEDKFQQIDKEMKEQEMLIKGYQQENEKLYLQMKAQQAKSKLNEEAMFSENQRLLNELAFTREQLNKTSRPMVGNVCSMDHTRRITELLAQINMFQRNEAKMSEDMHRLKQEKQALEVDLQLMKKERDLAQAQGIATSGDKTFEMRVLESKHREEVLALRKKLQWFSENQELLDRDANRLKAATAEIHQLKEQVEQLKMEVSKRSSEQQRKAKVKSVDTKRMKDLERQVKELEQILRHRNPNSLPALIYAAASASRQNADTGAASPPSQSTALLECRIQRLEAELESHDEEAKHSLRAMEQHLQRIKLCYEQRISELELELQHKQQVDVTTADTEIWVSRVQTLKEELQHLKDTYQEKEKGLCAQIDSLQQQLKHKAQSPGRHQRQAETAFGVRIEHLNQELSAKTRTIQDLTRTVARLQKEKTSMLSGPNPRPETKRQLCPSKTCTEVTFPAAQYEKTYQPTVFTGSHISEVLQENEALKQRLEQLQLQAEQERDALKADAAEAKEELRRVQEQSAEQLSSMKAEHLRVLDQLHTTYTLEHSSSKVAELTNKLNTQEIKVKHLQQQLTELQGTKDALVISRTREEALQNQLTRLLKELKEAKEAQSSEVKLLCSLERKLLTMELRHQHREKELQQVISGSWQTQEANQQSEVEHWRRLAQDKSRELEAFRLELDSILDILRHLQRQGVVFPTLDHQQLLRGANTFTGVGERECQ